MNIQNPHRVISLTQIINRNQARYKIHFTSEEELVNQDYWMKIIRKSGSFAHFEPTVVDETPEEDIEGLKKYSILYGLKYLFAAEMLNLETIPVKVLMYCNELDTSVVTEFFNADYLSLTAYEKGEFIDRLMIKRNIDLTEISKRTGFSYNSLLSMYSAYNVSKICPPLETAYKECRITAANVLHSKPYYEEIPLGCYQELTDYFVRNGNYAAGSLKQALQNRNDKLTNAQAILFEITSVKQPACHISMKSIDRISASLKEDGLELSGTDQNKMSEKMKTDRKYNQMILSYQTLKDKCYEAYKSLSAALPQELILDYDTAITLPDRTQFSYAVPPRAKRACRNNIPKDVNEKRLFARIMEYVDKTESCPAPKDLLEKSLELNGKPEIQQLFSEFFKFSIFYRNMRSRVIAENVALGGTDSE